MGIEIIRGTDREFTMRLLTKSTLEPKDLTGLSGAEIKLTLPGENNDLVITMTANANGSVLTVPSALGGKVTCSLSDVDTALLKVGSSQDMELELNEGGGPDFVVSRIQFIGQLTVKKGIFDE